MTTENCSPNECLERLLKILEEIPQGVSTIPLLNLESQELLHACNADIVALAKSDMTRFFKCFANEKLQNLNELKQKCPSEQKAWRPTTTGEADIKPLRFAALQQKKTYLLEEITKIKKQSQSVALDLKSIENELKKDIIGLNEIKW